MTDRPLLQDARILIVEDEIFIATALREYCLDAGAELAELSATVEQSLELIESMQFDLAVLDVEMPDGEVRPLAETLHNRGTRLLFHSGNSMPDELQAALPNAGFVMKPSPPDQLMDIIASALKS
ncbi:MAG: response regulator [Pseudomonadota bacterium]